VRPYWERDGLSLFWGRCEDVLPHLDLSTVSMLLFDPPYGDDHDTDYTRFSGGTLRRDGSEVSRYRHAVIEGDDAPFDPLPFLTMAPRVVMFGANRFSDRLPVGSWLVWDKRTPTGSKGVMSDAEVAWFSHGRGVYIFSHTWDGFNRATERGSILHPTQKPVALMVWILSRWSKPGDLILDPYAGSGPIAKACQLLGRRYIGIETVEAYVKATIDRLAQTVLPLDIPA